MAKPYQPPKTVYEMLFPPNEAVNFDLGAFDDAIFAHGVPLEHQRCIPCPLGKRNVFDTRAPDHDDHPGCDAGFLYRTKGVVRGLFTAANNKVQYTDNGMFVDQTVQVTTARCYNDGVDKFYAQKWDRLYIADEAIVVPAWKTAQFNTAGVDRMDFPVVSIDYIIDSAGNEFTDNDYQIVGGRIVWGQNNPGVDPATGQGRVYTCSYFYRPYWIVADLGHEIRVAGDHGAVLQAPQNFYVQREHFFRNVQSDQESERQVPTPPDGAFTGST